MDPAGNYPPSSLCGRRIGQYTLQDIAGRGGMGEVYRAFDEKLQRTVAVKVLPFAQATDAAAQERFLAEIRNACRVLHPFVAAVFDVVEHAPSPLLVMEFVPGHPLTAVREEEIDPAVLLQWFREIAEALGAIHAAGLVHRDLKPGNVMVTPQGHIKVMDFGVAQPGPRTISGSGPTSPTLTGSPPAAWGAGTVAYMSPEQLRGQPVDGRGDLFSLGILMFQLATGQHPFQKEFLLDTAYAILHDPPPSGPGLVWRGPPELLPIVLRLLEKDPARRYQTALEVTQALRALLPLVHAPRPPARRGSWQWAAAGVAVLALGMSWWRIDALHPHLGLFTRRPVVAVLPFEEPAGQAGQERAGSRVALGLARRLHLSPGLRTVDETRVEQVLSGLPRNASPTEVSSRAASGLRFDYLVSGRISGQENGWQAQVEIRRGAALLPGASFTVSGADPEELAERAAALALPAIVVNPAKGAAAPAAALSLVSEEARLLDRRAQQKLGEYRLAEAIGFSQRAVAADPAFIEGRVRLARSLYQAGFERRARDEIQGATLEARRQGLPSDAGLMWELAAAEAEITGDTGRSVAARLELAGRAVDDPQACCELASAMSASGALDRAQAEFTRCQALDPLDPRIRLRRADTAIALGRWAQAESDLEESRRLYALLEIAPGLAETAEARGNLELERGDFPLAAKWFRQARTEYEKAGLEVAAARAALAASDVLLKQGDLAGARIERGGAEETLRRAGAFRLLVLALNGRGGGLYLGGRLEEAETVLREALDEARKLANPGLMLAPLSTLANLLLYTGRVEEAQHLAVAGIALARETGDRQAVFLARIVLAQGEAQQGRFTQAAQTFARMAEEESGPEGSLERRAYALTSLAAVLGDAERPSEALAAVSEAIVLNQKLGLSADLGYALVLRAEIAIESLRAARAREDLDAAERLAGSGPDALADLVRRVALARAAAAVALEDTASARNFLLAADAGSRAARWEAEIELLAGRPAAALALAETWLVRPDLSPAEKGAFSLLRAQALLETGRRQEGLAAAREVLSTAEALGIRFTAARASVLLADGLEGSEAADLRRSACARLADYFRALGSENVQWPAPWRRRVTLLGCN